MQVHQKISFLRPESFGQMFSKKEQSSNSVTPLELPEIRFQDALQFYF